MFLKGKKRKAQGDFYCSASSKSKIVFKFYSFRLGKIYITFDLKVYWVLRNLFLLPPCLVVLGRGTYWIG